ncbi:MAG TPA: SDR family oxidoreductase [Steroidobacteraceae bacterium]|nr:SDR family oxidoreductase [Steroidobacteraceae bacterium]
MPGRLEGKIAVITGATSGIGEATARCFVAEGACVVIAGRSQERGQHLAGELGRQAVFHRADVMHEAEIAGVIDAAVSRFGKLDCLFNNAGASTPGELDSITEEQFDYGMRLLVGSVMFGIKHAARVMSAGGSIINNSSIAAHRLGQGGTLYSAAKAAVSHITRIAGARLGPSGIRVNSISPGAIATPIFWGGSAKAETLSAEDNARKLKKLTGNLARATPLPRSGVANDIAYAAVFLASDEGSFVNAHDLVVDGGRIAQFFERPQPGV